MKIRLTILILSFLCICCESKEENDIQTFVFSNAGLYYDYSLKFNSSDTIYYEQRFPSPTQNFYTIVKHEKKDSLFELIQKIDFSKYNSNYSDQSLVDGKAFRFLIVRKGKIDSIFIYGKDGPPLFYKLASTLKVITKQNKLFKLNKKIDFENLNYKMLPPPPPPPPAPKIDEVKKTPQQRLTAPNRNR